MTSSQTINPLGGAASTTGSGTTGGTTGTGGTERPDQFGKDTFLKLLVAQLKYQDPMNPADSTQFMAQTAQFTMVEKINELAKSMTEMLASERQASAGNMIGRYITGTTADGTEVSGTVTKARLESGGPILTVGDTEVALSAVKEVRQQAPK
jgi:flagellar basal-body rod modification protein FlgD